MRHTPSLNSIEERLSSTLRQFGISPGGGVPISGFPLKSWQLEGAVKNSGGLHRQHPELTP